jgi:hypothetical protein
MEFIVVPPKTHLNVLQEMNSMFQTTDYFDKYIPLICRLVGGAFIFGGILSLVIALLFCVADNNLPIRGLVILVTAGFIHFVIGFCLIKFIPKFILSWSK